MQIPFYNLKKVNLPYEAAFKSIFEEVLQSGSFINGTKLLAFEQEYAAYCGTKHCIGVGNGLSALTLIIAAYKETGILKDGDEVIVPANTFIASLLAISANNLVPVLAEPDERTYNLSPLHVTKHITSKTKCILAVHLYGQSADMDALNALAKQYGLLVIEDSAQAAGALYHGRKTGGLGHAAAHSFYPAKNLGALGDAGAITTSDDMLAELLKGLRNYGSQKKYEHLYKGTNSRLDELQAALLSLKLKQLDKENVMRRQIANRYLSEIKNPLITLPAIAHGNEHIWHLFVVRVGDRSALQDYLNKCGIETLIHYPVPPHKQPAFKELAHLLLPITEVIHHEVLSLPMSPVLTDEEVNYIIEAVNKFA